MRTQWFKREVILLAALQFAPVLAVAALATHDLAGTSRATPTTMGALEVMQDVGDVLAPAGLVLTVQRITG